MRAGAGELEGRLLVEYIEGLYEAAGFPVQWRVRGDGKTVSLLPSIFFCGVFVVLVLAFCGFVKMLMTTVVGGCVDRGAGQTCVPTFPSVRRESRSGRDVEGTLSPPHLFYNTSY